MRACLGHHKNYIIFPTTKGNKTKALKIKYVTSLDLNNRLKKCP